MAAYIIKPTIAQWSVIKDFLDTCGEGAIIIPPAVDGELEEQGVHIEDGALIDYDFGGESDIWIDVVSSSAANSSCALDAIKEHLGISTE